MKKIIAVLIFCSILAGTVGCSDRTSSYDSAESTNNMNISEYVTENADSETLDSEQEEEKETEYNVPRVKDNKYNIEGAYNTNLDNNTSDEVVFEVVIEHTADDGTILSETITLDNDTTYADLAVKLDSFGLVATDDVLKHEVAPTASRPEEYAFYGIGHNLTTAQDIAAPALYLELVDDEGIVTDTILLNSSDFDTYNPSVKAIGARWYSEYYRDREDRKGYQNDLPVDLIYRIIDKETVTELSVGMVWGSENDIGNPKYIGGNNYNVFKNNEFTLVVMRNKTRDDYIGDIVLIKN